MNAEAVLRSQNLAINKPSILFVDDEQRVLNSMRALFRRDYNLYLTTRGEEALEIITQNNIDVVVADQRMPIMSGVEVLSQIKITSPNTIRILLTGYANVEAIESAMNEGEVFRFLSKPCAVDELRCTIRDAAGIAWDASCQSPKATVPENNDRLFEASMDSLRIDDSLAGKLSEIMTGVAVAKRKKAPKLNSAPAQHTTTTTETAATEVNDKSLQSVNPAGVQKSSADPVPSETQADEKTSPAMKTATPHQPPAAAADIETGVDNRTAQPVISATAQTTETTTQAVANEADNRVSQQSESGTVHQTLDTAESSEEPAKSGPRPLSETVPAPSTATTAETRITENATSILERPKTDHVESLDFDSNTLASKLIAIRERDQNLANLTAHSAPATEDKVETPPVESLSANPGLDGRIHLAPTNLRASFSSRPENETNSNSEKAHTAHPNASGSDEKTTPEADSDLFSDPGGLEGKIHPALELANALEVVMEGDMHKSTERADVVEVTLGDKIQEDFDMTDTVEIIMSGDTHRVRDWTDTHQTLNGQITQSAALKNAAEIILNGDSDDLVAASLSAEIVEQSDTAKGRSDPGRMRVVGTGKFRVAVVVFSSDTQFANSVGQSLQDFFYTFHTSCAEQLMHAVRDVGPAVLITDISAAPEFIQELTSKLKQKVPEMVTMVATQHRDADLMVKMINHGQVFRMVDKPMSTTACKIYVRDAVKKHLELRRNPELIRHHQVAQFDGESKLPIHIHRLMTGLERVRGMFSRRVH